MYVNSIITGKSLIRLEIKNKISSDYNLQVQNSIQVRNDCSKELYMYIGWNNHRSKELYMYIRIIKLKN